MNVAIKDIDRRPFRIEVGYFDTVLDIKTRINKHQGVPIDHQILTFNDKVLDDNGNVESCFITHNVHIELHIVKPDSNTALLLFKLRDPSSTYQLFQVMDLSDSVMQCKHKLRKKLGLTTESIGLHLDENDLQDVKCLREYGLSHGSTILIDIKPPITPSGSSNSNKLLIQMLISSTTNEEILVDPTDKVQVLRRALLEQEKSGKLELPRGGYYFINKGHGMIDESRSFLENNVCHYDQIEIFEGTFTQ